MQLFLEVEGEESNSDMYTFMPSNLELEFALHYQFKKKNNSKNKKWTLVLPELNFLTSR